MPQFVGEWTRLLSGLGISPAHLGTVSEDELQLRRSVSAVLASGFPLVALLQLVRVYGQSMARIADAEVWLTTPRRPRAAAAGGVHSGVAMYRDADYDGRDVNIASRMAARSAGGEVLVTRPVVDAVSAPHLEFERIAEVRLKGFSESTEAFIACQPEDAEP